MTDRRTRRRPRGVEQQPPAKAAVQSGKRAAAATPRGRNAREAFVAWLARADLSLALIPLLGVAVGAFAYFVGALLLYDPAVWPDEALFANPAVNLLRHGHLGTDLMGGYLPGIETHTYWMPPLYYLALAPVFALFGVSASAMRLFSAFTAATVLVLTYAIGRRVALGRVAACIAVAVLAVDAVFLRAARVGRMDMLAIALVLGALYQALASPPVARAPLFAGVLAGLATMTHPLGMIAPLAIGLYYLTLADASRGRRVLSFALGALGPVLLWGIYILADMPAFSVQLGAQLGRKTTRQPFDLRFLAQAFLHAIEQYNDSGDFSLGNPRSAAGLVWVLGTLGVVVFAVRHRTARVLAIAHVVALSVVLLSYEMWYPVYCLPTLALGVGALAGTALERIPGQRLATVAVLAALVWFAVRNLAYEEGLHARWSRSGESADYGTFCDRVSALIPAGSRVLVSVFPDVYLCLSHRADLTFRSFVPEQLPVAEETQRRVIAASDIIITGRWNPGSLADTIARREGELVGEVGVRRGYTYHALIYRMSKVAVP